VGYDEDDDGTGSGNLITSIYTVDIAALVGAQAGGDIEVTATLIDAKCLPQAPENPPAGTFRVHGNGLIALTDNLSGKTFFFLQFNGAVENAGYTPVAYGNATVVRLDSSALSTNQTSVTVGKNAMGMVPLPIPAPGGTTVGLDIAVPCYGGVYQYGATNGMESALYRISGDIFGNLNAVAALVGDGSVGATLTAEGTRDFRSVAFSEDGLFGYVLAVTYNSQGKACWKLYQTTAANILGLVNMPFSTAIDKNLLVPIDGSSGLDGEDGADWEVVYENAELPRNGRLWLVKGTTIQVSQGSLYSKSKLFADLYDGTEGVINSADLIGEMIYQYSKGRSIETRLVKGKTVAKIARAAAASAAEEEAEK
jgi:hypothetical protein